MFISRIVEFDSGHRVANHHSKCSNVHGHRYKAVITLSGDIIQKEGDSSEGMVIDFGDIKTIAKGWIDTHLDHGYIGHKDADRDLFEVLKSMGSKHLAVDFVPTAENIVKFIFDNLEPLFEDKFGTNLKLDNIELWETPNCSVLYIKDNN